MIDVPAVGLFACKGLALPTPQLIEDRWPTAPVGVFARVCEECRDLVPAPLRLNSLQVDSLGDGLTRHGQLQGQAPGVQGGLAAGRPSLPRAGLHMVGMREEGGDRRGDEGGMQEGLQGAGSFGVDRIQAIHRLVQPDTAFPLPAHPVEVSDLPWADPGRQMRQEKTVPFMAIIL